MRLDLNAYAKINLYLDVVGRRENGYHDILSLMQSISLCDRITLTVEDSCDPSITLITDTDGVPTDERNLAVRAANAFYEAVGYRKKTEILLRKRSPVSAGLAGGSTDAAAVFVGLNKLLGEPFSIETLCSVGKKLGADIPFCILTGTAEVTGIGDVLSRVEDAPRIPLVVAKCGEGVSTPWAYKALDERYGGFLGDTSGGTAPTGRYEALRKAMSTGDLDGIAESLYNVFEEVVLETHSEARALKKFFVEHGAVGTLMSGSGPSVFAIFRTDAEAELAAKTLNNEMGQAVAFAAYPVSKKDPI